MLTIFFGLGIWRHDLHRLYIRIFKQFCLKNNHVMKETWLVGSTAPFFLSTSVAANKFYDTDQNIYFGNH